MTDTEIHALQDQLRPCSGTRPISPAARARYVYMADGDDARDLAFEADDE